MSEDILQINYDLMEDIAKIFADQADAIESMIQNLRFYLLNLEGSWYGTAADAFFNEMESEVFPALHRLSAALTAGGELTIKIAETLNDAEVAAAEQFTFGDLGTTTGPIPSHSDEDYGVTPIPGVTPSPPHPDIVDGLVPPPPPTDIPAHPDIDYEGGTYPPAEDRTDSDIPADVGQTSEPEDATNGQENPIPYLPLVELFDSDAVAPVVLIEMRRTPVRENLIEVELESQFKQDLPILPGVISAEGGYEAKYGYEIDSFGEFWDVVSGVFHGDSMPAPDYAEESFVGELNIGIDSVNIPGTNRDVLDLTGGGYLKFETNQNSDTGLLLPGDLKDAGIHSRAAVPVFEYESSVSALGKRSHEFGIPVSDNLIDPELNPFNRANQNTSTNVKYIHTATWDNVIQVAIPVSEYQKMNGDLGAIKEYLQTESTINQNSTPWEPTGHIVVIDTYREDHLGNREVNSLNNIIRAKIEDQLGRIRTGLPNDHDTFVHNVVLPQNEHKKNIFDYSGVGSGHFDMYADPLCTLPPEITIPIVPILSIRDAKD